MVCASSLLADNFGLIKIIISWNISAQSHFLLEINLGKLIALLSILDLLVPLVNQVIACCDMVMPVVFNTLLSIFSIEIELFNDLLVELILQRHLFFTWKIAHISISILNLE